MLSVLCRHGSESRRRKASVCETAWNYSTRQLSVSGSGRLPGAKAATGQDPGIAAGSVRTFTIVAWLIDTNILVYRFDPRFPDKQRTATLLLRDGLKKNVIRISHQALIEFMAAVTRSSRGSPPFLQVAEAARETEELLSVFPILYPNATLTRTAVRGMAAYGLPWFDANMWAYAEYYGLAELISEDFEHGRLYGSVRVVNPFRGSS